jgi:hypothetical protein
MQMRTISNVWVTLAIVAALLSILAPASQASGVQCSLADYKAAPGLTATQDATGLVVTWDGDKDTEVRMRLTISNGTPTIADLSVRHKGGNWASLGTNLTAEYRVVSGIRRAGQEQLGPLRAMGIDITTAVKDREKWFNFWDAPLTIPGDPRQTEDLPRKPEEIRRATSTYQTQSCDVKTDGARLQIEFSGLNLGIFAGQLQFVVFKGTNLIRMEAVAKTEEQSVAYKYDAGFKGLPIKDSTRVMWRDLANLWDEYDLDGQKNDNEVALRTSNRIVIAESPAGSIAAFPPPHIFFWARETDNNLGYSWYRKDNDSTFSFGVRQAEHEDQQIYQGNFALYSAPPGSMQRMAMFFYASPDNGKTTLDSTLAFTHSDHYKALPGYETMAHHYHTKIAERMMQDTSSWAEKTGNYDLRLPDISVVKDAGITIMSPADFHGDCNGWDKGPLRLKCESVYYQAVRKFSDKKFLIEPDEEVDCESGEEPPARSGLPAAPARAPCPLAAYLGGHWDVMYSHPVYWTRVRQPGQPLVEQDPTYGKVYHVGSPADIMDMMHRENLLIYMAHPRTKGSTGYPDKVKDSAWLNDEAYRGIGWRWGMGLDLSQTRMGDDRATAVWDDMNNWVADLPTPPKYILGISETRFKQPADDDVYGMSPVNYIKVSPLPKPDDTSSITNAFKRGDYFVSTGEVLIPSYSVQGSGDKRTITADVEWTFPLDFAEVVWGDGQKVNRKVISLTDLPAFGKHHFLIPFDTTGKKWVRFAVWDAAGDGALVQPVKLNQAPEANPEMSKR